MLAITSDPFKIPVLDEQKRFYHDLYKSKSTNMDCKTGETLLSILNINVLQLSDLMLIVQNCTICVISEALNRLLVKHNILLYFHCVLERILCVLD